MTRAALALAFLAAACVTAPRAPAPSPPVPARAAAQPGFRAATPQGVDLVYDPARRSYAVSGRPDVYWLDGRFFRQASGSWESSPRLDGPWRACEDADLPEGLR